MFLHGVWHEVKKVYGIMFVHQINIRADVFTHEKIQQQQKRTKDKKLMHTENLYLHLLLW